MFDFETDRDDPRFSPDSIAADAPERIEAPVAAAPVTQNHTPSVKQASPEIPPPPANRSVTPTTTRPLPRPAAPKRRDWLWLALAAGLIVVFSVMGIGLAVVVNASGSGITDAPTEIAALPTPVDARMHYNASTLREGQRVTLDDGQNITLKAWDGTSRWNVLLLGIDRRAGESGLAYRTDTIMIASFDPATQQLGILSIPRDLYVQIPGYSKAQRINTALPLGEQQRAGYGPTLAMQTVQANIGMPIHDYVIADFNALVRLVDAIGGIDVQVAAPIADYDFPDAGYGYDPLILAAGLQHLDGYTAQKYARTRHGDSDFDRARRQQQVIFAIRDRVLSTEALPSLIIQAPSLYGSVSQNVDTSLTLDQMIRLALWLKDLPGESIKTGVMDQHYVSDYTTEDGAQVLVPYSAALPTLLTQVFGTGYAQ